jgi:hypothetical protein
VRRTAMLLNMAQRQSRPGQDHLVDDVNHAIGGEHVDSGASLRLPEIGLAALLEQPLFVASG